jgi:hypothetical protein
MIQPILQHIPIQAARQEKPEIVLIAVSVAITFSQPVLVTEETLIQIPALAQARAAMATHPS